MIEEVARKLENLTKDFYVIKKINANFVDFYKVGENSGSLACKVKKSKNGFTINLYSESMKSILESRLNITNVSDEVFYSKLYSHLKNNNSDTFVNFSNMYFSNSVFFHSFINIFKEILKDKDFNLIKKYIDEKNKLDYLKISFEDLSMKMKNIEETLKYDDISLFLLKEMSSIFSFDEKKTIKNLEQKINDVELKKRINKKKTTFLNLYNLYKESGSDEIFKQNIVLNFLNSFSADNNFNFSYKNIDLNFNLKLLENYYIKENILKIFDKYENYKNLKEEILKKDYNYLKDIEISKKTSNEVLEIFEKRFFNEFIINIKNTKLKEKLENIFLKSKSNNYFNFLFKLKRDEVIKNLKNMEEDLYEIEINEKLLKNLKNRDLNHISDYKIKILIDFILYNQDLNILNLTKNFEEITFSSLYNISKKEKYSIKEMEILKDFFYLPSPFSEKNNFYNLDNKSISKISVNQSIFKTRTIFYILSVLYVLSSNKELFFENSKRFFTEEESNDIFDFFNKNLISENKHFLEYCKKNKVNINILINNGIGFLDLNNNFLNFIKEFIYKKNIYLNTYSIDGIIKKEGDLGIFIAPKMFDGMVNDLMLRHYSSNNNIDISSLKEIACSSAYDFKFNNYSYFFPKELDKNKDSLVILNEGLKDSISAQQVFEKYKETYNLYFISCQGTHNINIDLIKDITNQEKFKLILFADIDLAGKKMFTEIENNIDNLLNGSIILEEIFLENCDLKLLELKKMAKDLLKDNVVIPIRLEKLNNTKITENNYLKEIENGNTLPVIDFLYNNKNILLNLDGELCINLRNINISHIIGSLFFKYYEKNLMDFTDIYINHEDLLNEKIDNLIKSKTQIKSKLKQTI